MIIRIRTANGEHEVPQSEIERAAAQLGFTRPTTPAPTGTGTTSSDPTVIALRETVTALSDQMRQEREERARERAETAVDRLIEKGKVKPASRDHWVKVYLADRQTFDALTAVLPVTQRLARTTEGGDGNIDGALAEHGTGGDGDEGEGAATHVTLSEGETSNGNTRVMTGADSRWERGVNEIMKAQGVSARQAGEILQLREPNLWHARREELAGMKLPKIQQRNNRHTAVN